jgi:hypothetical protein
MASTKAPQSLKSVKNTKLPKTSRKVPMGGMTSTEAPKGVTPVTIAPTSSPINGVFSMSPLAAVAIAAIAFGENSSTSQTLCASPFGGGVSNVPKENYTPPCKLFVQGKCRNGELCKFSHVIQNKFSHDMFSVNASQRFSAVNNSTSTSFGSSQRW